MHNELFKILMVEDNARYLKIYQHAFETDLGCQVEAVSSGEEALQHVNQDADTDLIILDLNLPGMSGEDVLRTLRADPSMSSLQIMILTGETELNVQPRLLGMGADDFVEKGADPAVLMARIRARLRHKQALDQVTSLATEMEAFTSGVLHDIRNIESSMVALCYLTRMQVEEDPQAHQQEILDNLDQLAGQAGRLSEYAGSIIEQVREGQSEVQPGEVRPEETLAWIREILGLEREKDGLELDVREPLQSMTGDPNLIRLAVLNLVQNSAKYAREGVRPRLQIYQKVGEGGEVITCFRDNGRGIPDQELRRVFEPFVRGSRNPAEKKKGFGLGLSMVARVMRRMGGRVWAEQPDDGQPGALLCLSLPAWTPGARRGA